MLKHVNSSTTPRFGWLEVFRQTLTTELFFKQVGLSHPYGKISPFDLIGFFRIRVGVTCCHMNGSTDTAQARTICLCGLVPLLLCVSASIAGCTFRSNAHA